MTIDLNGRKERECLEVKWGKKKYMIPLGAYLPPAKIKALKTDEAIVDFLGEYMGKEVAESLTVLDLKTIMEAWTEATAEASGVTPGES
jgi:hypothetical protein